MLGKEFACRAGGRFGDPNLGPKKPTWDSVVLWQERYSELLVQAFEWDKEKYVQCRSKEYDGYHSKLFQL